LTRNLLILTLGLCVLTKSQAATTNSLVWQTANDRVSADIRGEALWPLLADIAHQTGWHIFIEPGVDRQADVKFKNLSTGDALKKLLGDLNFAFVPQTNGPDLRFHHHDASRDEARDRLEGERKAQVERTDGARETRDGH
jgi:hypothetical protein